MPRSPSLPSLGVMALALLLLFPVSPRAEEAKANATDAAMPPETATKAEPGNTLQGAAGHDPSAGTDDPGDADMKRGDMEAGLAMSTGAAQMSPAPDGGLCTGFGPQAPRDIGNHSGENRVAFPLAPPPAAMNLCNIHTHTNAEHRGPGFPILSTDPEAGGFKCKGSDRLSAAELLDPAFGHGPFGHVSPGDTIEVHWVYSSCDVRPGPGLGACLSEACANPTLRVESQVFLVVNDPFALDFATFAHAGTIVNGRPQPRALPSGTGSPVIFRGSTTGPAYTDQSCSPLQVTWSVRPNCARLDISSLYRWTQSGNVFDEDHAHGVRTLVTAPVLLAPIH